MKALIHHEDVVSRSPYNVSAWILYLDEVDSKISDFTAAATATLKTIRKNYTTQHHQQALSDWILLRHMVGCRSVQLLPRSYKLWKTHWEFVMFHRRSLGGAVTVLSCLERAIVTLHKFPRVWMDYLDFAHQQFQPQHEEQNDVDSSTAILLHPTQLRRLVNRAMEALPISQHEKIWPIILKYYQTPDNSKGSNIGIPKETKLSILRRYVQFHPSATKEMADFLAQELGQWGEAALWYIDLLNDNSENGAEYTTAQRKDLWMSLSKICTRYPVETELGLDFQAMVRALLVNTNPRSFLQWPTREANPAPTLNDTHNDNGSIPVGAMRYLPQEMNGVLWTQLADAWIRRGRFQLARSVYEEAIESVSTVRDFTILLDAYLQFEEGLLEAIMDSQANEDLIEDSDMGNKKKYEEDDDWDILSTYEEDNPSTNNLTDLELALARAEDLTSRRPILLNRVLLRQNPDDVGEWLKRARLYKENGQIHQAADALEEGLQTVKARRAVGGNPNEMVLQLANIYDQDCKDLAKARRLFDRICNQWVYEFKNFEDLAVCFAAWVELELREEAWDDALDIIRSSVIVPPNAPKWTRGLAKSIRLWDLLLDLEESLGTVQTTKDAYNRALDQKVATPLHILNYATYLTEQKYFEESFSAYERGIELFSFPGVKLIWRAYLDAFLKRYGGSKIERARDLFQRCLEACPPEESTEFFLMNGKYEEEHGLTKRALSVYREMCQKVPAEAKYTAYQLFIAKTAKFLGQTATRDIYQNAIQDLEDGPASKLCLDFADMETSLQEFDRARAVLTYGAQMADPRRNDEYWSAWNEFEVSHGNEETFREMLRVKRSVEASFSTVNYNAAEMSGTASKAETLSNEDAIKMIAEREGMEYDERTTNSGTLSGFVGSKRSAEAAKLEDVEERVAKLRKATGGLSKEQHDDDVDADEIDIDEEHDEEKDDDVDVNIQPKPGGDSLMGVNNITTKAVPVAVFGGLVKEPSGQNQ